MHEEYELRFKLDRDLTEELEAKGFRLKEKMRMADLIFEPKEWKPGDMISPGYHVVRVRLTSKGNPRLEVKEFAHGHTWKELGFDIAGPAQFVMFLAKIMAPRRVLEKQREVWSNGNIEVCFDDVKHLGRFIEIEGPRMYVDELAIELGFKPEDRQPNYGSMLFYLEKTGFIAFRPEDMQAALTGFGFEATF